MTNEELRFMKGTQKDKEAQKLADEINNFSKKVKKLKSQLDAISKEHGDG